jgi:hypothetical protein
VGGALDSPTNLFATLTPTSAMVDYHHSHPSVIVWSLANESHFNLQFLASARMVKELDPTRPTTFNHDFANSPSARVTDIANIHYPSMPYDDVLKDDPRPLFLGEYFFPICHEQTDVAIDPGLRELWGFGHAEPDSAFSRACALDFDKPPLKPGLKPGGWSYIYHSDRVIGGAIWASHDDAFYFSATNHAGYAWHHGFWGLIDYWRRPKPEWWLARHIFSPVWLETRHVPFVPGQKSVRVPVENRYAFTDLSELKFNWQLKDHKGRLQPQLAPGTRGELEIPLPQGIVEGDSISLHAASLRRTSLERRRQQDYFRGQGVRCRVRPGQRRLRSRRPAPHLSGQFVPHHPRHALRLRRPQRAELAALRRVPGREDPPLREDRSQGGGFRSETGRP